MKPEHEQPIQLVGGVITVSSSRDSQTDNSGKAIKEYFIQNNIPLGYYGIVTDNIGAIRAELIQALQECNFVVVNGGTGLTHDDCTIEAISPILEKKIDGFGELFRIKSYEEIGTSAMLSRAIAGISGRKAIFCIPGSTGAVSLAMKTFIIPEIRHILSHANR